MLEVHLRQCVDERHQHEHHWPFKTHPERRKQISECTQGCTDEDDPVPRLKQKTRIRRHRDLVKHMVCLHIGQVVDALWDQMRPSSNCGEVAPFVKWT